MCVFSGVEQTMLNQWLSYAVENKVEDLVLYSVGEGVTYELPLSIYTCSSLELSAWVFDEGLVIAWNSLKSLKLDLIGLDDDDIVNLLSGCPALETLGFSYFWGFRRLEITSSNLKRLILADYSSSHGGRYDSLEIIAPHIQHFEISGDLGYLKCRLVNVSSLVTANLSFSVSCITDGWEEDSCRDQHQVFRNLVLDYFQKLSCATELIIGSWIAEVVFMLQLEGVMLPELKCKCLTLKWLVREYNLYGIASLLQTSPLLESLNIHIKTECKDPPCLLEQSYFAEVDNINLLSWIPNTVFPSLRNAKIVGCLWFCLKKWSKGDFCKLFELSKCLLKNAVALQKFVIVAKRRKCGICSQSCVSRHLSGLAKKLIDSQRSSTNFAVVYQEFA
ncbi:f-boxlrr-repeat protein [Nicotiana attenuata]|uniref:F-boxlrr-repeat protein n=1 Tax=Nicotiana attenuata TaxID=49451 RepID=A0A314KTZ7_NICAT|nr:f-boxlrr-repeat protein [Nicotiana attenuata]